MHLSIFISEFTIMLSSSTVILLLLFLLIYCCISILGLGVTAKYGVVTVSGYDECTFINDGKNYTYKYNDTNFSMENKLLFGFIYYRCGTATGYLLSRYECKPCLFHCSYNEMYSECNNYTFKYIVGGFCGLFLGILIWKFCPKLGRKLMRWINYKLTKKRQKSYQKSKKIREFERLPTKKN